MKEKKHSGITEVINDIKHNIHTLQIQTTILQRNINAVYR